VKAANDVKEQALIRRFWTNESGATAIEYGLIVGIMSMVVVSIAATGGALDGMYERIGLIVAAIGGD
jgi:pilus assembly protein Flp/PilA